MSALRLFLLLPSLLAACAEFQVHSALLTAEQRRIVIERAREKVVTSSLGLGPQELEIIMREEPSLSYYFLAKPHADYTLRWPVANGEAVRVFGRGNLFELEGAVVERAGSAP